MTSAKQVMYIKELIKAANELDKKGLYKEADIIDSIMVKIADNGLGVSGTEPLNQAVRTYFKPVEMAGNWLGRQLGVAGYENRGGEASTPSTPSTPPTSPALSTVPRFRASSSGNPKYLVVSGPQVWLGFTPGIFKLFDESGNVSLAAYPDTSTKTSFLTAWGMNQQSPTYKLIEVATGKEIDKNGPVYKEDLLNVLNGIVVAGEPTEAPKPAQMAAPTRARLAIPKNTRGFIDIDGDEKYAYTLGDVGTKDYRAYDRATGRLLGTFSDAAGRAKVEQAMQAKAIGGQTSFPDPHGSEV